MTEESEALNFQVEGQAVEVAVDDDAVVADLDLVIAQRDEYLDQLQRAMADFANYRRRIDQERVNARAVATREVLQQVLPLADDMRRGLGAAPEDQLDSPLVQGFALIQRKLDALLEREGVESIDALGTSFDPSKHEAVAVDPGSTENKVVEVYQTGYQQAGHLLRPAMVRVGDLPKA